MVRRGGGRVGANAHGGGSDDDALDAIPSVDLHGLRPTAALARLELAVHAARVRGAVALVVVTGRGASNATGEPVLRTRVEDWTRTEDARRRGVRRFERISKGGALRLALAPRSTPH